MKEACANHFSKVIVKRFWFLPEAPGCFRDSRWAALSEILNNAYRRCRLHELQLLFRVQAEYLLTLLFWHLPMLSVMA
jgi:hypothetical protein